MRKFDYVVTVVTLLLAGCLYAAENARVQRRYPAEPDAGFPLSGPVLGYVAQESPLELRAILGVPGSAVLSEPLPLPASFTRLHLAPDQSYALAECADADPVVFPLRASEASLGTIAGALRLADFVAFSPRGQSAVLYSAAMARLQVIGGLPDAPRIERDLDTSTFPEPPAGAAISDDAQAVLLTSSDAVYQLPPGGTLRQLLSVDGAAALTFLPNSTQAAIADRGAGAVYLWPGAGAASQLIGGLAGLGEMRPSSGGLGLWLTNPGGNTVWWLGVKTQELRTFSLPVSPAELQGLALRDTFLVASSPGQPAWILFQEGGAAMAAFVPAARKSNRASPGAGALR